jgi:prepilin-type processing-associated H-X9-DG protein
MVDLIHSAINKNRRHGTSYRYYALMGKNSVAYTDVPYYGGRRRIYRFKKKSLGTISSHQHVNKTFGLQGRNVGPTDMWLLLDNNRTEFEHFPGYEDNHGKEGGNVYFADGHTEWVAAEKYLFRYELSEDEGRADFVTSYTGK